MKKQHTRQEVLVPIRTTLAKKVLFEKNDSNKNTTPLEKFEESCWNGLLNEMFSELMPHNSGEFAKIFIWDIYAAKSCLVVDLADTPGQIDSLFSIDPYLFLPGVNLN